MIKKWNSLSLIVRILIGLVIGAILGLAVPNFRAVAVLGTLFVGALKAIAPVLVAVLVAGIDPSTFKRPPFTSTRPDAVCAPSTVHVPESSL